MTDTQATNQRGCLTLSSGNSADLAKQITDAGQKWKLFGIYPPTAQDNKWTAILVEEGRLPIVHTR